MNRPFPSSPAAMSSPAPQQREHRISVKLAPVFNTNAAQRGEARKDLHAQQAPEHPSSEPSSHGVCGGSSGSPAPQAQAEVVPSLHSGTAQSIHSEARFTYRCSAPVRWGSSTWRLSCENEAVLVKTAESFSNCNPCRPRPHIYPQHKHHRLTTVEERSLSIFLPVRICICVVVIRQHPAPQPGRDDRDSRWSLSPGKHSTLCPATLCTRISYPPSCPTSVPAPQCLTLYAPRMLGMQPAGSVLVQIIHSSSHRTPPSSPSFFSYCHRHGYRRYILSGRFTR